ncbi:MAG: hypothetical protein ACLRSW_00550 [Christensenellaceae bacterium]
MLALSVEEGSAEGYTRDADINGEKVTLTLVKTKPTAKQGAPSSKRRGGPFYCLLLGTGIKKLLLDMKYRIERRIRCLGRQTEKIASHKIEKILRCSRFVPRK